MEDAATSTFGLSLRVRLGRSDVGVGEVLEEAEERIFDWWQHTMLSAVGGDQNGKMMLAVQAARVAQVVVDEAC